MPFSPTHDKDNWTSTVYHPLFSFLLQKRKNFCPKPARKKVFCRTYTWEVNCGDPGGHTLGQGDTRKFPQKAVKIPLAPSPVPKSVPTSLSHSLPTPWLALIFGLPRGQVDPRGPSGGRNLDLPGVCTWALNISLCGWIKHLWVPCKGPFYFFTLDLPAIQTAAVNP